MTDPHTTKPRIFREPPAPTKIQQMAVAKLVKAQGGNLTHPPTQSDVRYQEWVAAKRFAKPGDTFDGEPL